WHVNCLCFTTSKLLSRKEFIEHMRSDKEVDQGKYVKTIPENAARYLNTNSERIKGYSSKPYFIQDNFKNTKDGFELKSGDSPNKPPEIPKPVFVPIKDVKGLTDHFAGFA